MSAKRLHLYLILGGAAATILATILLTWLWGRVHDSSDRFLVSQASVDTIEGRIDSLEKLKVTYQAKRPTLDKLSQALPERLTSNEMTAALQGLSAAAGTTLTSIEFRAAAPAPPGSGTKPASPPSPTASRQSLSSTVKISGSFAQIRDFISRLNQLTPLTDMTRLTLAKPVREVDSLEVTLELRSYGLR